MGRCITLAIFVLLTARGAQAQTIFQSSDGESSLTLRDGGLIHINFGDASVSFGLARQVSTDPWHVGFNGKLKAKDNFVSLVKDGFALREGEITGFLGYQSLPDKSVVSYQVLGGRFGYTKGSFDLLSPDSIMLEVSETTFNGGTLGVFYNAFLDSARGNGTGQEFLLGIAVDYGRRHNADRLDEVEVCEGKRTAPTDSGVNRSVSSCKDASFGMYETSNRWTAEVDFLWYQAWSSNRLAIGFLGRYDDLKNKNPFVPGFGVFITETGAPLKMQGGVTLEAVDGETRLGVQIGFPF